LEWLAEVLNDTGVGRVASVSGRYFAMDRDKRWDRTEKAYRAMVEGKGLQAKSAAEAVDHAYQRDETDEFVTPTVIVDDEDRPVGVVRPGDVVLIFNFRADRVRQITRALADPDFSEFERPYDRLPVTGMTAYDENFTLPHLFDRPQVVNNLSAWLSKQGVAQFHTAETEKYAHVTFFFNGGQEKVYDGEDRLLIPSPKVATYDLEPAMSAEKIADAVLEKLDSDRIGFILLNFANADMVGHTGKLEPTQEAVRVVDRQIQRIADAVLQAGGALVIVSDHGNAEEMQDEDGGANTNHTTNPVPLAVIADDDWLEGRRLREGGGLEDVAPTVLDLMQLPKPAEMQGQSLLRRERDSDE
jgi:2,3-bisphosphoglycerate-independent phosphoglycerate mutase